MTASPIARRPYFPALDGVRAIAALMVFVFHFFQARGQQSRFFIGQTGVDLFFVLSGFLITLILLETREDEHAFSSLYIRRALRIFPLYYGYLVLSTLFHRAPAWQYWVYLQNFAIANGKEIGPPIHFWSLAVEEHFYFVWPILVLRLPKRLLPFVAGAFFVSSVIARIVLAKHGVDIFYPTECRLDGLALGALLALAYDAGMLRVVARSSWFAGTAALLTTAFLVKKFGGQHADIFQITKPLVFSVLYAAATAIVLQNQIPFLNRYLSARPLRAIGRISYGLYVFHPALIQLVEKTNLASLPLQFVLALCLTFAVSWASWTFYEKPFLSLKSRFTPGRPLPRKVELDAPSYGGAVVDDKV